MLSGELRCCCTQLVSKEMLRMVMNLKTFLTAMGKAQIKAQVLRSSKRKVPVPFPSPNGVRLDLLKKSSKEQR